MTDITHEEVRDAIPDLLHDKLDLSRRGAVENHLRSCAECDAEMRVVQMVKSAPSFAPMIDAVKVTSSIPPYGGIPAQERPVGGRVWKLTLAIAAAAAVVLLTVVARNNQSPNPVVGAPSQVAAAAPSPSVPSAAVTLPVVPPVKSPVRAAAVKLKPNRELQVAVGLDGLSDVSVAQLAREINALDGLPSTEPENWGVGDPTTGGEGGQ